MTFTDDDLKRLKEWLPEASGFATIPDFTQEKLKALLDRMEASERFHKFAKHFGMCKGIYETCVCGFSEAHEAWLKSKGESK